MKKLITIASIFLLVCCSVKNDKPASVKNDKPVYVGFSHDKKLDNTGFPSDSMACYFPEKLFTDTILCYINQFGQISDPKYLEKERRILYGGHLENLRDTFKIETDSSFFRETSYMLFKMKEPVLSDRFLNKDIYRITSMRSFHKPIVIRIEKQNGKVSIISKELNRPITYPFFVLGEFMMFDPPGIKTARQKIDYEKQYEIAKRENDSLRNLYNNTNYFLTIDNKQDIPYSVWDSLEILVDSAKFWNTKPELHLNSMQIDGSMWYIEGHFKSGYQIKRIPSPHFSHSNYPHNYDKDNYYARIFKFLFENAKLENEELY